MGGVPLPAAQILLSGPSVDQARCLHLPWAFTTLLGTPFVFLLVWSCCFWGLVSCFCWFAPLCCWSTPPSRFCPVTMVAQRPRTQRGQPSMCLSSELAAWGLCLLPSMPGPHVSRGVWLLHSKDLLDFSHVGDPVFCIPDFSSSSFFSPSLFFLV